MTYAEIEQGIRNAPALVDPIDSRDYNLDDFAGAAPLPATFSIRDEQTSIKNQSIRGTCVGFASTGLCEFFNDPNPIKTLDLSEEYLFKKIKEIDMEDYGYDGYGSYLRSGAKALNTYGTCLETSLLYSPDETEDFWKTVVITNQMNVEAAPFRLAAYTRAEKTVDGLKTALVSTKSPVLCGFMLYKSYRLAQTTGFIPTPVENEERIGGHAMIIVGYTATHFIVKNSWGTWGDGGYLYWPFEAIKHIFSPWSFFSSNSALIEQQLIEENRKRVPEWGLPAWDRAIAKGVITGATKPLATMSKVEMMVFFDRLGLL